MTPCVGSLSVDNQRTTRASNLAYSVGRSANSGIIYGMTPIPSDAGRQHYVQWNIPSSGYCLYAEGTISGPNPDGSTFTVHFAHRQRWSPPARCANAYFSRETCIAQREEWWDDNGSPFALRIDRTQQLARGLGVGFTIRQTFPITWGADGRYFWRW